MVVLQVLVTIDLVEEGVEVVLHVGGGGFGFGVVVVEIIEVTVKGSGVEKDNFSGGC